MCRHFNDTHSQRFLLQFLANDIKEFAKAEFAKQ